MMVPVSITSSSRLERADRSKAYFARCVSVGYCRGNTPLLNLRPAFKLISHSQDGSSGRTGMLYGVMNHGSVGDEPIRT